MDNIASPISVPVLKEEDDEPPSPPSYCLKTPVTVSSGQATLSRRAMLFGNVSDESWNDWKWQFRHRITTVEALENYLPLSAAERTQLKLVTAMYPLSITPHYLSLIDPDDPDDPVRRQAVPSFDEIVFASMGEEDPLEEKRDSVVPGLVHRYPDRVLMVLTDLCPMLCRHCTRKREWRHGGWIRGDAEIDAMMAYISAHPEVRDVILSGGDPLTLSTKYLEKVISKLRKIEHVEIIRIGSRYPVVLPQRIDKELCSMLSANGPIWLNTHFNHYREITPESVAAVDRLLRAGVPVNNQTVLLKGVNDSVEVMSGLVHGLLKAKIRPYYLFQCDEVQGTEHLRTPVETGLQIIEGLRGHTSGLAIPTFVIDLPQGGGKVPLQPNYVLEHNSEELVLRNYAGKITRFRNPQSETGKTAAESIEITEPVAVPVAQRRTVKNTKGAASEDRISVRS